MCLCAYIYTPVHVYTNTFVPHPFFGEFRIPYAIFSDFIYLIFLPKYPGEHYLVLSGDISFLQLHSTPLRGYIMLTQLTPSLDIFIVSSLLLL